MPEPEIKIKEITKQYDNTGGEEPELVKIVLLDYGDYEVKIKLNKDDDIIEILEIKEVKKPPLEKPSIVRPYNVDEMYPEEEE